MVEMKIRSVQLTDFDSIYRFVCGLEEQEFDKEALRPMFQACLENDNHIYLIAEMDGVAVGYISCHGQILLHHCGWVYEIQELYVLPAHRSNGVGAAMVAAVENELLSRECVLLEVVSNMRRTRAHTFYEAIGFIKTSYRFAKEVPRLAK